MGACSSCCKDNDAEHEEYPRGRPLSSQQPSAADVDARRQAAEAAQARHDKFDSSAVGRAARKAVEKAKKEKAADAAGAQQDNSRDWLS